MAVGPWQILVVLLLLLLLFGASRLSEIGKGLGEGIRNFKKGLSGERDDHDAVSDGDDHEAVPDGDDAKLKQLPEKAQQRASADDERRD
jgi:sec-independent protein translocase protein TatA